MSHRHPRLGIRRVALLAVTSAPLVLLWLSCLAPTQVRINVTSDQCARGPRIAIDIGTSRTEILDRYARRSAFVTRSCVTGDSLGTLVLTPGSSRDATTYVTVRAAFDGKDPLDCKPENKFAGCVVARRSFHYLASTPLELPIRILGECTDAPCTEQEGLTCSTGRVCINDGTVCEEERTCVFGDPRVVSRPEAGAGSDGGTDGAGTDAAPPTNPGQCQPGDAVTCGATKATEPPRCAIDDNQVCCAVATSPSHGICVAPGKCGDANLQQQYCCTDGAECGAPSSGLSCCYRRENVAGRDVDVFKCRPAADCTTVLQLCGGGADSGGRCPTGYKCSPQRGSAPFFACIKL